MTRPPATPEQEALLREFLDLDQQVAELEEQLGNIKARRNFVGEHELLEAVDPDERRSGLTLSDGSEWTFEQKYHCSFDPADEMARDAALEFLDAAGASAMVKRRLTLEFGTRSQEAVAYVKKMIDAVLPHYEVKLKVGAAPAHLVEALQVILQEAGLDEVVELRSAFTIPGASLRSWMLKQYHKGVTLPPAFSLYAPLQPKRVMVVPSPAAVLSLADEKPAEHSL